jgi:tRNA nucleotidyltransferase/poly(A) polymerase
MTTISETEQELERTATALDEGAQHSHARLTPTGQTIRETAQRPGGSNAMTLAEGLGDDAPDIDPARLDSDAVRVLLRLKQHGHQAYLVGGCVRDLLIGRTPKDFDIATSATPTQVKGLFRNCRLIGRRFRLAHVYFRGGKILEVSTFRANPAMTEEPAPNEAAEGDVHAEGTEHIAEADREALAAIERGEAVPDAAVSDNEDETLEVESGEVLVETGPEATDVRGAESGEPETEAFFATQDSAKTERDLLITEDNTFGTEREDALRRDFTINGLFYDPVQGRVIDHVQGLKDLAEEQLRTIGDPEQRMREDPVRILRAVRFAGKLRFEVEPRTYAAMEGAVEDLPRCSAPRLLEETFRLIRGGGAAPALELLLALDGLKFLLPPVDEYLAEQDSQGRAEYFKSVAQMDALVNAGTSFDDSMLLACILLPIALDEPEPPSGEMAVTPSMEAPAGAEERQAPEEVITSGSPPAEGPGSESATSEGATSEGAALSETVSDEAHVAVPPSRPSPAASAEKHELPERPPSVAKAIELLLSELVRTARLPRRIAERCRMILLSQKTLAGLRRRRGGLQGFRSHPLFQESLAVFEVWVKATGEHQAALNSWKSGGAPVVAKDAEGPRRRRRRRKRNGPERANASH